MSRTGIIWVTLYTIMAGTMNFKSSFQSSNAFGMAFSLGSLLVVAIVFKSRRPHSHSNPSRT